MSTEATCKTLIQDQQALIETLEAIYGQVVSVQENVIIKGYITKKQPTVLINIPGLYGTAGFYLNKDGNYELVYDSMDRGKLKEIIPHIVNEQKIDKLNQTYAALLLHKKLEQMRGRIVQESSEGETIRIRARISNY